MQVPPAPPNAPTGRRTRAHFAIAVAATAAVGVIGATLWAMNSHPTNAAASGDGSTTSPSTSTTASALAAAASATAADSATATSSSSTSGTLLTPAGIETFVKAMPSLVGTTKVYELTLYPDYAEFEVASKSQSGAYDDYEYENGQIVDDTAGGELDSGENEVDLTTISWSVIPGLITKSDEDLNVKNPTDHYVIVDPNWAFATGTSLRVYCTNAYGGGYLLANLNGKILSTYPLGS